MARLLAVAALALLPPAAAEEDAALVIRKVGFPELRIRQREACGQRTVARRGLEYFWYVLILGFRQGTCPQAGYTYLEGGKVLPDALPLHRGSITVEVYSRPPTALDVTGCISRECGRELSALQTSPYVLDVARCIKPGFGPCAEKAWACLGDGACSAALQCLPRAAGACGQAAWELFTDPEEREKVACIWQCGNSTACVLQKCGKLALQCFTGIDAKCHRALVCLPQSFLGCSGPAFKCVFGRSGVCRENLACLARGSQSCADPAVNMLTDRRVPHLMTCAHKQCPAPAMEPATPLPLGLAPPSHYPQQLACMGLKCTGKVAALLRDRDLGALATCATAGSRDCGGDVWECLGDDACAAELRCWSNSALENAEDAWRMATDPRERAFDAKLLSCVSNCSGRSALSRALCIAGSCGVEALRCGADATCRRVLTALPAAILKCGPASLRDEKFLKAGRCARKMLDRCGRAAVEMLRDEALTDVLKCNAQCTRPPVQTAAPLDIVV